MAKTTKKRDISPTVKQKAFFKEMVEDGRNKYKCAKKAGYSDAVAIATKAKIENTAGYQSLVEKYLPEDKLMKVHSEGLAATQKGEPDYGVRHKYLDTAYKIKGGYEKDNQQRETNIVLEIDGKTITN